MSNNDEFPDIEWTKEKREAFRRKRRGKNLALMGLLFAFVVLVYIVSIVRMGGG
jgi:hypothetical protein